MMNDTKIVDVHYIVLNCHIFSLLRETSRIEKNIVNPGGKYTMINNSQIKRQKTPHTSNYKDYM